MKIKGMFIALLLGVALFPSHLCWGWTGKVTSVLEGDLMDIAHDGRVERIQLFGIDCPEKNQAYGREAKAYANSLAFGREVEVEPVEKAQKGKGRASIVFVDGKPLNQLLILEGYAWYDPEKCKGREECRRWQILEAHARATRAGLWVAPDPVPPWEFDPARKDEGRKKDEGEGKQGKGPRKPQPQTAPEAQ